MISALIAADLDRDDGTRTSLDKGEIADFCVRLGGIGAETVTKLVGTAIVVLSQRSEQWNMLRADRSKIPAAIEELLRFEGPVQYDCRYTLEDVEVHETTIPAGSTVMLLGASANRDERAFTNADAFDINRDRTEAQSVAFGYGTHSCLRAASSARGAAAGPRTERRW
jgi:cytochrome P450